MSAAAVKRPILVVAGVGNGSGMFVFTCTESRIFDTLWKQELVLQQRELISQIRLYANTQNTVIPRRLFAKQGYRVALIARNADHLKKTADEINAVGGEVRPTLNSNLRRTVDDMVILLGTSFSNPCIRQRFHRVGICSHPLALARPNLNSPCYSLQRWIRRLEAFPQYHTRGDPDVP